ncbi:hypothetical protein P368_10520 [Comamonas thiooxydans]|nr:hypothetical protein P369_09270 [Comamonas thiooxydans]KGG98522.1 hypothetical protein P367_12175 [Comamonas thiooxydans]KGH04470.1 hypothetical protein P365_12335 [Comamonas thiooxydans]KGH12980.1 hypothetical protein P368_10520 [Comamonas thiooxydans]
MTIQPSSRLEGTSLNMCFYAALLQEIKVLSETVAKCPS